MKSFRDVLVEEDIRTVARFVEMEFVRCGSKNTRYHTAANGWPDHETRNAPAIPFVGGELSVDIADDDMTGIQRQGLAIFRQGCVICHEGRMTSAFPSLSLSRLGQPATSVDNGTVVVGMNHTVQHGEDHHDVDEYADNTVAPRIDNLTPQQQLGEVFYQRACVQCHARDGSGQHWVGRFLRPSPADFNDPALLNRYDDAALAQLISQGRPKSSMPAFWGILSADQSAAIIAYMRRAFAGMK